MTAAESGKISIEQVLPQKAIAIGYNLLRTTGVVNPQQLLPYVVTQDFAFNPTAIARFLPPDSPQQSVSTRFDNLAVSLVRTELASLFLHSFFNAVYQGEKVDLTMLEQEVWNDRAYPKWLLELSETFQPRNCSPDETISWALETTFTDILHALGVSVTQQTIKATTPIVEKGTLLGYRLRFSTALPSVNAEFITYMNGETRTEIIPPHLQGPMRHLSD